MKVLKKQYTKDIESLCFERSRVGVIGYMADIEPLISRLLYAKSEGLISSVIVTQPDPQLGDFDMAFVVSDYPYSELPGSLQRVKHGILYSQEMADMVLPAVQALDDSDWMVIRDLERKFLTGTALNQERESLRQQVDFDIGSKTLMYD